MCGAPRRAHVILSRPQQQKTKQQQVRQDALLFRTAPRRLLRHHLPRLRPDDGDDGLPPPNHSRQDTNATPRPDTGTQRARCSQQRTPAKGARQPLEGNKHAPPASAAAAASAEDPSTAALLADTQEQLEYRFNDPALLLEAVTHTTRKQTQNYQRLEFLGDRVLALLAAEALFAAYPDAAEGQLAPRLNDLVCGATCAAVIREAGLDRFVRIADANLRVRAQKTAILADALESILGAMYLDGSGLDAVRPFFNKHWASRVRKLVKVPLDPKTRLQHWTHAHGLPLPAYELVDAVGPPHNRVFTVKVIAGSAGSSAAFGQGRSKQAAQTAAAQSMLRRVKHAELQHTKKQEQQASREDKGGVGEGEEKEEDCVKETSAAIANEKEEEEEEEEDQQQQQQQQQQSIRQQEQCRKSIGCRLVSHLSFSTRK